MARPPIPLDIDDIVHRYERGERVVDIARTLNVSHTTIQTRLRSRNALRKIAEDLCRCKRERMIQLPIDEIIGKYVRGISVKTLSRIYGVSPNVIDLRLHEAGVHHVERRTTIRDRRGTAARTEMGRARRAQTSAKRLLLEGAGEGFIAERFEQARIEAIRQAAVGRYNVDLLVGNAVAVEVMTCSGTPYQAARYAERLKYVLKRYAIVIVWIPPKCPLSDACAQQTVILSECLRDDPSTIGQYWVVRGDGKIVVSGDNPNHVTRVPPTVRALNRSRARDRT